MPNPKRRHSKSRRGKRRAHDAIQAPLVMSCPQCKEAKEPHRVCRKCGYYDGRAVIEVNDV
jgi:large subunit ribosomal protein L32